ncbi:MAG: class I SAM-dependent methyltransferase [Gemmatimonadetes bacterium]|nr:class I SAM-dependent methyltransferase [Gemmatimonadota bacterium]
MPTTAISPDRLARFRAAYALHREAEGRRLDPTDLAALPYLDHGPFRREWSVRARTFEALVHNVVTPLAKGASLRILDVGAGAGWLCFRLIRAGHHAIALDWRWDQVDGLGAAQGYRVHLQHRDLFDRVGASFDALPLSAQAFDVVVFNAAIHYAEDLAPVLAEARRVVRPGGRIAILDSPFYARAADGDRMVAAKRREGARVFGKHAEALMALRPIEYLTTKRLADASAPLGLTWQRHHVRYPLWYELRPLAALLSGRRRPSRFDLWVGVVS